MNKKAIYSLFAASALVLASCDYNEDNFPGFDESTVVTDVVNYTGEFTGEYPDDGYFTMTIGDQAEGRAEIEGAIAEMLSDMFPFCDEGSTARITVSVADILPSYEKEPVASIEYELTDADYDAMGTEKNQPGQYNNFSSSCNPNNYLPNFCATKWASEAEGTIVKILYKYYSSGKTNTEYRYYGKQANGNWRQQYNTFDAGYTYTMVDEDYQKIYADPTATRFQTTTYADVNALMAIFLKDKYQYLAEDGTTVDVSYAMESNRGDGSTYRTSSVYRYSGQTGEWSYYDTGESLTLEPTDRIAVFSYVDGQWTMVNFISGVISYTLAAEDYQILYDWVKENKSEYLSTQTGNTTDEYYFGASTRHNNINNQYNTWITYYNVGGYLTGLTNDQIQAIMDQRLAEGLSTIVLPAVVDPQEGYVYEVIYNVYGGRGSGDYAMSFNYDPETSFTWDGATPVAQ